MSVFVGQLRRDYGVDPILLVDGWVELSAELPYDARELEVFDSSGVTMQLGYGAAGAEVESMLIPPGGFKRQPALFNKHMRLCARAVGGDSSAAGSELIINFYR